MRALSAFALCACVSVAATFSSQQEGSEPTRRSRLPVAPQAPAAPPNYAVPAEAFPTVTIPGMNQGSSFFVPGQNGPYYRYGGGSAKSEEGKANQKILAAKKRLTSKDEAVRADAEEALKDAVSDLFDVRTKSRTKQIKDLEVRLASLRKQIEQRQDKKTEIVRLHVQTIVNQARGLGF